MHPRLRNLLLTTAALLDPWGNGDHACTRSGLRLAPSLGTFTSVDAASFGGGLRLGWLNAVTADLTVTQVAQGQVLLGTTTLPSVLSVGPRRNTRFFFILSARL